MNMFKKNGGFTLVELIVVIAILAILAGVAVPAYSGYIARAEEAADLQILSAVYTAAAASLAEEGKVVTGISVDGSEETQVTITPAPTNANAFAIYIEGNEIPSDLKATWASGTWTITPATPDATE